MRFLSYEFEDPYDQIAFKLEPFGIQKLFTGCKFQFNLTFQPWDSNKLWIGKIIFVSYNTRLCQYYQSELVVRCLPKYSNLIIRPDSLSFGEIPIWKTYEHCKTIKVVVLTKFRTPCCKVTDRYRKVSEHWSQTVYNLNTKNLGSTSNRVDSRRWRRK